jgi:hypothetical protein
MKPRGRPPLDPEGGRPAQYPLKLSPAKMDSVRKAAAARPKGKVADWLNEAIDEKLERERPKSEP